MSLNFFFFQIMRNVLNCLYSCFLRWRPNQLCLEGLVLRQRPRAKTQCFVTVYATRGCTGVVLDSKPAFKKIVASNDPFYCPHCSLAQHKNEIDALKAIVEKLFSDYLQAEQHLNNS